MPKKQFRDDDGINHVSLVKSEYEDASIGIPIDVYHILDEFYADNIPPSFRQRLYDQLWNIELREPQDFLKPDAKQRYMQALRHAIASDAVDATRFILDKLKK